METKAPNNQTVPCIIVNSLEQEIWRTTAESRYALTIKDIIELKKDEEIKFLIMDRNLYDVTTQRNEEGKQYDPETFFGENFAIYKHENGLKGKILFSCLKEYQDFEFHLYMDDSLCTAFNETSYGCWYPLTNQYMPAVDEDGFIKFAHTELKHYSKFPDTTKVGWRGPMIKWTNLKIMPKIYWRRTQHKRIFKARKVRHHS